MGHDVFGLAAGSPIYRARVFAPHERPELVREVSYPPLERTVLQRANRTGEPVFYASATLETTLAECRVRPGDHVVIGEWRCARELVLRKAGFPEIATQDEFERLRHELFLDPDRGVYPHTSAIARDWMQHDHLHGLAYPSVADRPHGLNIALKPAAVDALIGFAEARMFRVERVVGASAEARWLASASAPDGVRLEWS